METFKIVPHAIFPVVRILPPRKKPPVRRLLSVVLIFYQPTACFDS